MTGKAAAPVSHDTLIFPAAPTFTAATAKNPVPLTPGMFTMPSLPTVAPSATTSGTGVVEAVRSKVLTPDMLRAGLVFSQSKVNRTSVESKAAVGYRAITNVCRVPPAMSAEVLGVPLRPLVAEFVV
jgi:hypothetical protein